ncbi:MAG TPA: hypothetical protein VE989_00735 [Sphingomicrobium sp.]|nr:hypothetical protein [Sphingomicrobium sp.]
MADDDSDPLWRALNHPAARALMAGAAIAGFFVYAGKRFSSPEGRRSYFKEVRKAAAERREHDAWHERQARRHRAKTEYMNGPGRELWRQRAQIVIGPENPFPDARFEFSRAGFRQSAFTIRSESAGAKLHVGYDVADRDGSLLLAFDDGRRWGLSISAGERGVGQYQAADTIPDVDMARLACRLLATPQSPFSTITLLRPESSEIYAQIWRDYLAEHPELEDEPWPFR